MKPLFHHSLVNNFFGDPCLYVRLLRERCSLLFDLGDISALTPAQMNRITDVFVTHMHMDHFIGFDLLLRKSLRKESPLAIYGPPGIIQWKTSGTFMEPHQRVSYGHQRILF
jgi:ribonuclease Z